MTWSIKVTGETYEEARENFSWDIPDEYDAPWNFLEKHGDPKGKVALFQAYPDGRRETYTFHDIDMLSNKMANAFESLNVGYGDKVGIVLPQKPATPICNLACWKMGAVSVPLSVLFGGDGLQYRLNNSGANVVVADSSVIDTVLDVKDECESLEHVIEVDGNVNSSCHDYDTLVERQSSEYEKADVGPDTPSIIVYTSGSTGKPKGVVHTHKSWVGHCPGFYMYFDRDIIDKSIFWTQADWAWLGGLADVLLTAWHYGRPVVGYPMGKFDPEEAYDILEEFGVTDTFLPPTAIRKMMDVEDPANQYDLDLDTICSGGEPLTTEIIEWVNTKLDGVTINEFYGQTEANMLTVNCHDLFEPKPGSIGKAPPGRETKILDSETGEEKPRGEVGEIAVKHTTDDPVLFKEYWKKPEKTESVKFGEWHLTGDLGYQDEDGYFWYKSRADDVIITSGYRVGPEEVEDTILKHPDVKQTGVVGVPDETRGEIIKACVTLRDGIEGSDELREEIEQIVRNRLAKYEYPRQIEFRDELPTTTTGKISRKDLYE